ncbi:unnamed protein product [Cochlearia groenlandica]
MVTCCVDDVIYHSLKDVDSCVPIPPPFPSKSYGVKRRYVNESTPEICVSIATRDMWDRLFNNGYKVDVVIYTDNGGMVYAHANIIVRRKAIPI